MSHLFFQSMQAIGSFSEHDIEVIRAKLSPKTYEKGDLLLDLKETCNCFWFLEQGSVHSFYLNSELDQVTTGLYIPGDWIVEHTSFTSRTPSTCKFQAFEKTEAHILTIHDLHDLIGQSQVFFQLGKILGNPGQGLHRKEQGPDERYLNLLECSPELIKTFPLKHIASYLGVTPETLSRVRKRIRSIS